MKLYNLFSISLAVSFSIHARAYRVPEFKYVPPGASIQTIKKQPYMAQVNNFISDTEIQAIKRVAEPYLKRSMTAVDTINSSRTSSTAFLEPIMDPVVPVLQERAARMLGVPTDRVEIQVVRYQKGQQYTYHYDFFTEDIVRDRGSQRVYTFFVYLNDLQPDQGGGTDFPELGVTVRPQKGSAVFWRNIDKKGEKDYRMSHAGLPVAYGEKWGLNIWVHDNKIK